MACAVWAMQTEWMTEDETGLVVAYEAGRACGLEQFVGDDLIDEQLFAEACWVGGRASAVYETAEGQFEFRRGFNVVIQEENRRRRLMRR
jgi:hypothetical protein